MLFLKSPSILCSRWLRWKTVKNPVKRANPTSEGGADTRKTPLRISTNADFSLNGGLTGVPGGEEGLGSVGDDQQDHGFWHRSGGQGERVSEMNCRCSGARSASGRIDGDRNEARLSESVGVARKTFRTKDGDMIIFDAVAFEAKVIGGEASLMGA